MAFFKQSALATAILLAGICGCRWFGESDGKKPEDEPVLVRTAPAEERSWTETVEGLGRCEALPNRLVSLSPAIEGQVQKILVKLGDPVKPDETIVQLDPAIAAADLAEKEANRDAAQAAFDLLTAPPRPEDRKGLEAALGQAQVGLEKAQALIDRLRPLHERNEISGAQMSDAEQSLAQANLQQEAAAAQLQVLLIGPRKEAVQESRAKVEAAEGAAALSKAKLDQCQIRSPIEGVLNDLSCHPGQTVPASTPIGEVVDTRQLQVTAWLPIEKARQVAVDQTATILLENSDRAAAGTPAAGEASGEATAVESQPTGRVESVGQIIDPQTGNLPVRILVENGQGRLVVGQTVTVSIAIQEHAAAIAVPFGAVFDAGEGPTIIVIRNGGHEALHPTAVITQKESALVSGTNLKRGEPVVVEGGFNLKEDSKIEIREADGKTEAEP